MRKNDTTIDNDKPSLEEEKPKMLTRHWVYLAVGFSILMLGINSHVIFGHKNDSVIAKPKAPAEVSVDVMHSELPKPVATQEVVNQPVTTQAQPTKSAYENVVGYLNERAREQNPIDKLKALRRIRERELELKQEQVMRDSSVMSGLGVTSSADIPTQAKPRAIGNENDNVAFLNQVGSHSQQEEVATLMGDLRYRIGQGKIIRGVIESAINSDLPGMIRAHVTQDVYGDQGDIILIPNGSRLIGQYRSGKMKAGQTRVYVAWTRLIEPNGVTVNLSSPGSDSLGRAGMTGAVDKHFVERFGSSFLMSILSVGAATYGVSTGDQYNSKSAYREGLSNSFAKMANDELEQNLSIQNTIRIHQGTTMSIIVAKDISFEQVLLDGGML